MKKTFLLLLAVTVFSIKAAAFPVTLKVIDQTKGQITNKVDDNNETNIFVWVDDALAAQNPRVPSDWWYPMYNDGGVTSGNGSLVKTASAWEWTNTFQATAGTYTWNPYAKTLGWQPISPNMYNYIGDDGNNLRFTVGADGTITGHTELIIPDPSQVTKFSITLKVVDYTKGGLTDAPGTWAQNANIVMWVSGDLNDSPWWFYGLFDTTVSNWDGQDGNVVSFPQGSLIKESNKWTWQATFQAAPGVYEWNPMNILLGWASIAGGNLSFSVSATGELSGNYILELGGGKIACIGDSNTAGAGVSNPAQKAWPAQMRAYMGEDDTTLNLGVSGATLMNFPEPWGAWTNNPAKVEALINAQPAVVLVALGTNDSKDGYWGQRDFKAEYIAFINRFQNEISPKPEFYMIIPIKAFDNNSYGINNTNIVNGVIPAIKAISKEKMVPVIDWYSITASATYADIPDGVHANDETSRKMAEKAAAILNTPKPIIIKEGQGEKTTATYAEYRWYRNGELINGATQDSYTTDVAATYNVAVKLTASAEDIIISGAYELTGSQSVKLILSSELPTAIPTAIAKQDAPIVIPNPVTNYITVAGVSGSISCKLYDTAGHLLVQTNQSTFDVSHLSKGLYLLQVNGNTLKVIKR
ncbi:MAG: GDSL-type esterase/lipase family protein [Dysgonamonadaceae bacterium]|nr:GDSL-type esterase/lipase family protein [Dysgonamonadaceae bacterium]